MTRAAGTAKILGYHVSNRSRIGRSDARLMGSPLVALGSNSHLHACPANNKLEQRFSSFDDVGMAS